MNAFYTTNESSTRHHISDTGYEQPRNEDYDVCPPSESDCPMITVWRWPSLVLSPASDTSTHFHIITLTQCKCQMFTNSWVKLSRSPMLGSMVVVTNPLRWSSSGCMTLRQSRRQGKSRISEMKLPPSQPRPPRQPNLLSTTKHYVDPVVCCTVVHKKCQALAQNPSETS